MMNYLNIAKSLAINPAVFLRSQHLFLISHMRGNTSLLSHILGSHPDINGYFEMHIGYYSWKSLIRQKLLYSSDHSIKKSSNIFFDKVLHNDHAVSKEILQQPQAKFIIMVREPEATIKSIVNLYRKNEPEHDFCHIEFAAEYYDQRLREIGQIASQLENRFYFLESNQLIDNSDKTLADLTAWIGLNSPLTPDYKQFKNTGKARFGDTSDSLLTGKIQKKTNQYSDIQISDTVLNPLNEQYQQLIKHLNHS